MEQRGNRQNRGRGHQGGHQGQRRNDDRQKDRTPRAGEERPKKEAILDLGKYRDQAIRVKLSGGREVVGLLKGYDQLLNLVLEEANETLRDPEDENLLLDKTRPLGTVVVRGPLLQTIAPVDGTEVISNPFVQEE